MLSVNSVLVCIFSMGAVGGFQGMVGHTEIGDLAPSDDLSPFTVLGTSLRSSNSKEVFTLNVSKVILLYRLYE